MKMVRFRTLFIISLWLALFSMTPVFAQVSSNVELLATMNHRTLFPYNDCWGYTAPDGREYALLGSTNGTSIIDITDVDNVREVDFVQSINTAWKDIKTYQNYAYVVTDGRGNGLQIIDLSTLPDSVRFVSNHRGSNFFTSHNIYIDEPNAMLYAIGEIGDRVRAISLSDPENPVQVSTFGINCHDMYARDNIVYIAEASRGTISIYDLSEPQNPAFVSRFPIPNAGYAHNCWLSEDGNYLITTEETVGKTVKYWDIRDLNNVTPVSEYLGPDNLAHNAHIKGSYAYISHYTDGLRILDLQNPQNIREVGFYDTFDGQPSGLYDGAWGAFPFFDSGKILISDIRTGLYVVRFTPLSTGVAASNVPDEFALRQNYPNPFNPSTVIRYEVPQPAQVSLAVFNLNGQRIRTLVREHRAAGSHAVVWDGKDEAGRVAPAGMYFFRMHARAGDTTFSSVKKGVLVK